ncbi:DUF5959 family protein [Saccharopolyspora sp. NPDC000359]|uniref:DUF5959 family protein n=1 Tax=Saccharopolyspora sp. NPDC000359 TaxID=3154251 RepID=UPI00331B16E3
MSEVVELVRLSDGQAGVVVRVLRAGPDWFTGEVVVATPFGRGQFDLQLSARDIDDWGAALDRLAEHRSTRWLANSANPEISTKFSSRRPVPLITVQD